MGGLGHLARLFFSISTTTATSTTSTTSTSLQTLHLYYKLSKSSSFSSSTSQRRSLSVGASLLSSNMEPPIAKKVKHEMEMFGDVRVDNYFWLRDDSRSDPQVLAYLHEENAYTDHLMSGTKQLEDQMYIEIRGRLKEDDISAPLRQGSYYYYRRTLEGKEYAQHCRRLVADFGAQASVNDTMPTGPDAPPEHVLLDENVKAQEHAFYSIGAFKAPNNTLVAYAEDTKGDEIYTVYVIDAESRKPTGKPLVGVTAELEWAGDDALVYTTRDEILRPDKVWFHKLGMEQSLDRCLYHEKDDMFSLDLAASESKKFLFVESESKTTRFVFYLDISKPEDGLIVLTPRLDGIDTSASHRGNHFFIKRRSDECFNSEILACPLDNKSATIVLLPHRPSVNIQDMQLFSDHLVVYERENGLPKITIYCLPAIGEPLDRLQGGRTVDFIDPIYSVNSSESQFSSSILRFRYSSMRTPPSVYDYDMNSGISALKKIDEVLGGFDSANYITERQWATAADGTQIPISIVYRKDLVKLDGSDPLFLYGYGSYEVVFVRQRFHFCSCHIRGGGEMGRPWYENGKLLKKKNTFTDFIACAEYLIEKKYSLVLLIGAVINMRPDLFKAAVAGVPFVDVLTTMLDPTIPLQLQSGRPQIKHFHSCFLLLLLQEWGDPRKEEFYFYMKSYSPVETLQHKSIQLFL
ncbi:hypothetical protein Pfo_029157 [Paulownia fortunei]|nr:hypothetical protein Pfo_029157 [Paulownia fortunei]